ncbi:MAG: cache domain-containing protein [Inhella sp.]|nr:cache domain-containing protein [Inhella sp.]
MPLTKPRFAFIVLTSAIALPAWAQERGSKEEATAMVKAGIEPLKKVGVAQARTDFTEDKANWNKKDLYVMVHDGKNVGLAHGANKAIVGKDMGGLKDAKGVVIVVDMNKIGATKGKGWLDSGWPHPQTQKIETKTPCVEKLPSGDGFIAVGVCR